MWMLVCYVGVLREQTSKFKILFLSVQLQTGKELLFVIILF